MKKKLKIKSIGNDIIDLQDSDSRISSYNSRFLQRVLSKQEQKYFSHPEPGLKPGSGQLNNKKFEVLFWSIWSLKEAAYKAMKRIQPEIIFSPKQFIVSNDLSNILYKGCNLTGKVKKTKTYIHSVAYYSDMEKPIDSKFQIRWFIGSLYPGKKNFTRQSYLVRYHFKREISKVFSNKSDKIIIVEKKSIPTLRINERAYPVSYSHHGRFVASSILIN